LHALYSEGGVYLDTDVEVIKDFAPLLHHKCFVGFQQEEEQVDWVNTAVLGAQPGHRFITRCMELTQKLYSESGEFYRSPTVTTMVLKKMGLSEYGQQEIKDVKVYPREYFYPYPWFGKFSPDCIKANTYCIHCWEKSWGKKEHLLRGAQMNLEMSMIFRSDLSRKMYYLLRRIGFVLPPAIRGQKLITLPINTAVMFVLKPISKLS
jgi:mannosyltransferase OCH1-like enzyme